MAASDEQTRLLELFQLQHQEGPCLDAFLTRNAVVNADLRIATDQWPVFASHAAELGFRAVHAIPLRLRDRVIGALNLFGADVGGLDPDDVRVVQALADVATIGLLQEQTIHRAEILTEQLQGALNNRVVTEQAKGLSHAPTTSTSTGPSNCCAPTPEITISSWSTSPTPSSPTPPASPS